MGTGPNYAGLDKGFRATDPGVAYVAGEVVKIDTAPQSCRHIGAAMADIDVAGVCLETVDASKVIAGKTTIGVRLFGLAQCIAGVAITKGARLTTNASNRVVPQATAGGPVLGIAMEAQSTVGSYVDVLLTPGATLKG